MHKSETLAELFSALSAVHGKIKGVGTDKANTHFGSRYASLAAIIEAVNPVLAAHGLCLLQFIDGDHLRTILGHKSGEWLAADYPIRAEKATPQGVGSAITYARRYSALAVLNLAPEDELDDDGEAAEGRTKKAAPKPKPAGVKADFPAKAQPAEPTSSYSEGFVQRITTKQGTSAKGREWTRYSIQLASDEGEHWFTTFKETQASDAQIAIDEGRRVGIQWKPAQVGNGRDILELVIIADEEAEAEDVDFGAEAEEAPF